MGRGGGGDAYVEGMLPAGTNYHFGCRSRQIIRTGDRVYFSGWSEQGEQGCDGPTCLATSRLD